MKQALFLWIIFLVGFNTNAQSRNIIPFRMNFDSVNQSGQIFGHYGIAIGKEKSFFNISSAIGYPYKFYSFNNISKPQTIYRTFQGFNSYSSLIFQNANLDSVGISIFSNSQTFRKHNSFLNKFIKEGKIGQSNYTQSKKDNNFYYYSLSTPPMASYYNNPAYLECNYLAFYNDSLNGGSFSDSVIKYSDSLYDFVFFQAHANPILTWMIGRTKYEYHVYLLNDKSCVLKNTFMHNEYKHHPKIHDFNKNSGWACLSDNENMPNSHEYFRGDTSSLNFFTQIAFYDFNQTNGNISLIKIHTEKFKYIYADKLSQYYGSSNFYYPIHLFDIEFSPNDSILYGISNYSFREKFETTHYYYTPYKSSVKSEIRQFLWKGPVFLKQTIQINDNEMEYYNDIELMGDGRLYISKGRGINVGYNYTNSNDINNLLVSIDKPNKFGSGCSINLFPISNTKFHKEEDDLSLPEHFGRFSSLEFKHTIKCNAIAILELVEKYNDWDTVQWFCNNTLIPAIGNSIHYQFNDTGTYLIVVKGKHKDGYEQWYTDRITILPQHIKPKIEINTVDSSGCQWHTFKFKLNLFSMTQFNNNSYLKIENDSGFALIYDNNIKLSNIEKNYTFTKHGRHRIAFIVNNSFCSDSVNEVFEVFIKRASQPGITVSPDSGCGILSTLIQLKYKNQNDSVVWSSDDNLPITTSHVDSQRITLNSTKKQSIFVTQYGNEGCITRDTAFVRVDGGLNSAMKPELAQVSVRIDKQILISWHTLPFANTYKLYRNGSNIAQTKDSSYIDRYADSDSTIYQYSLIAFDKCGNASGYSLPANNILLKGKAISNTVSDLNWNLYKCSNLKPEEYIIHSIDKGIYKTIGVVKTNSSLNYNDNEFAETGKYEKCYSVEAKDSLGNEMSLSNIVCFPYKTIYWIPSSFSPNNDGINDTFKPYVLGLRQYKFSVYNSWGELLFETEDPNETWSPVDAIQGVYMYTYSGLSDNGFISRAGTVLLIR